MAKVINFGWVRSGWPLGVPGRRAPSASLALFALASLMTLACGPTLPSPPDCMAVQRVSPPRAPCSLVLDGGTTLACAYTADVRVSSVASSGGEVALGVLRNASVTAFAEKWPAAKQVSVTLAADYTCANWGPRQFTGKLAVSFKLDGGTINLGKPLVVSVPRCNEAGGIGRAQGEVVDVPVSDEFFATASAVELTATLGNRAGADMTWEWCRCRGGALCAQ